MNGEIFYEYIANVLFPWLQQNNPTVSCISNPICFDDHNPFTSSILDFIATNNYLSVLLPKRVMLLLRCLILLLLTYLLKLPTLNTLPLV